MKHWLICVFVLLTGVQGRDAEECNGLMKNGVCLPYALEYKGTCLESEQCKWMGANSRCKNKKCLCEENYRWYKGSCIKIQGINEHCQINDDCYNGYDSTALSCFGNVCRCFPILAYERNNGTDCRSKGLTCAFGEDCIFGGDTAACIVGKCCLSDDSKSCTIDKSKDAKDDTAQCSKDDDSCKNILQIELKQNGGINGTCIKDNDCGADNLICFEKSCVCKQGYFLQNGKCIPELGMVIGCQSNTDCIIKGSRCTDQACTCRQYWFHDDSNRKCIKTMIQSNWNCLSNEWCYAMGPYTFCNTTIGQCQCSQYADYNEVEHYCVKRAVDIPDDWCNTDDKCDAVYSRCVDEKCVCQENYHKGGNGICEPNINSPCGVMQNCSIKNSECLDEICSCKSGYTENAQEDKCFEVRSLNETCEEDVQCSHKVKHAICSETEKEGERICKCEDTYKDVQGDCYKVKEFGAPCGTKLDCTKVLHESVACRNSICQCSVGFIRKGNQCEPSSARMILGSYVIPLVLIFTAMIL